MHVHNAHDQNNKNLLKKYAYIYSSKISLLYPSFNKRNEIELKIHIIVY